MKSLSTGQVKTGVLFLGGLKARTGSGAPTNGSSGTDATFAAPNSIYIDKAANGAIWQNIGTQAAPVWSPLTPVLVNVSSANILAMNGAPVTLIAAPPAGYSLIVNNILAEIITTATQYASGGVVTFPYHGGAVATHAGSITAATINAGAGTVLNQLGPAVAANGSIVPTATGVDITNATGAFTTGTGTMKVFFSYSIIKQ